jgi:hypothetical protein
VKHGNIALFILLCALILALPFVRVPNRRSCDTQCNTAQCACTQTCPHDRPVSWWQPPPPKPPWRQILLVYNHPVTMLRTNGTVYCIGYRVEKPAYIVSCAVRGAQ